MSSSTHRPSDPSAAPASSLGAVQERGAVFPHKVREAVRARLAQVLPAGSLRRRLAAGTFWSLAGSGLSQAFGLASTIVTARLLGAVKYGELGMVLSTSTLFATVATVGLGVTATKYVAELRTSDPGRAGRIIGMSALVASSSGVVVAAVMAVAAGWLARETLAAPELAGQLRLGAIMMLLTAFNGSQTGVLSGFEAFRALATANAIRGIATLPLMVAGTLWAGLTGAVVGQTVAMALGVAVTQVAIRRECRRYSITVSHRIDRSGLALLWRFSLPALVAGLSFTPAVWWSNALLATRASYAEGGIFNAARQWQMVVMFLASGVANLGLPMLSNVVPERNFQKYARYLGVNFALTAGLALAVSIPVALLSPWLMAVNGSDFEGRAAVLVVVCGATVLTAANVSVGQAIWSLGASRAGMALGVARGAALVAAAYMLVDRGALGLALAYLAMALVQTALQAPFMLWLLRKQRSQWTAGPAA